MTRTRTHLVFATVALLSVAATPHRADAQTFRRPVACDSCIANWYYFDHDGGGGTQDWNCGASTYDGHRGSDFSLAGGNPAIDTGYDIVAVADGTVRSTADGFYDHCSTCDVSVDSRCGLGFGGGFGNHVAIDHGSYTVYYAHMRSGSVAVAPGDHVTCGQVIGQIGSSGCTTGAHTHVEPRPLAGAYTTAFDPFMGGCSATSPSLWTSQGAYRGMPEPLCDGTPPPPMCPAGTYTIWTCNAALTQRERCIAGVDETDVCRWGSCIVMRVGVDDECPSAPDADGDGSAADVDCNDADPSVHPGASDACGDGVDQDCAGGDAPCPGTDAGTGTDAGNGPDAGTSTDSGSVTDLGPIYLPDGAPRPDGSAAMDGALGADGGGRHVLSGGCCGVAGASTRGDGGAALFGALVLTAIAAVRPSRGTRRRSSRPPRR